MTEEDISRFLKSLEKDIINNYGHLVGNKELYILLGYKNSAAFRQAVKRDQIPIPIFTLENRRGKFALAKDITEWLTKHRFEAMKNMK